MTRLTPALVLATMLAACGGGGDDEAATAPGTILAEVTCTGRDSLLATVYMTSGEAAGSSAWCACGTANCTIEFAGLGYGDYVLGIAEPDTAYRRTEGAGGMAPTIGYYSRGGLGEVADTITISETQPSAQIVLDVAAQPAADSTAADTTAMDTMSTDTLGM